MQKNRLYQSQTKNENLQVSSNYLYSQLILGNETPTLNMEHHSLTEMHFHSVLCRYEPSLLQLDLHPFP